jgi:hypothetical protein
MDSTLGSQVELCGLAVLVCLVLFTEAAWVDYALHRNSVG